MQRLLVLATVDVTAPTDVKVSRPSLVTRMGERYLNALSNTAGIATLVGETALRGMAALAHRTRTRAIDVVELVREAGFGALGIVAIVNALIGAIIAFVGAVQLQRFGAEIYVANLLGVAITREMAALVTAIVMAGRTGGAYAAHLATMQGNEEIDALNAFGISVFDFLVLPRIAALVTMMPLLYIYGCAIGLFGGFLVSILTMDLTPAAFLEQLRGAVASSQFAIGFIKSVVFGALIALTSCFIGLRAGRSAADVGRAATAAVVVGIIGIIAIDAVFAVCTNALDI
jgi:phospholipid/cholesterol/gamma-HCH transport system permease protein